MCIWGSLSGVRLSFKRGEGGDSFYLLSLFYQHHANRRSGSGSASQGGPLVQIAALPNKYDKKIILFWQVSYNTASVCFFRVLCAVTLPMGSALRVY